MSRPSRDGIPSVWSAAIDVPGSTPSWLAPPLESQVFPVSPSVGPAPEPEPERELQLPTDVAAAGAPAEAVIRADAEREDRSRLLDELRAENEALKLRLRGCVDAVAGVRRAVLAASEPELVRLACVIAARVLRREVTLDPSVVTGWAREAAESLPGADTVTVACAPDLAAVVAESDFRAAIANLGHVEVDPSLASMSCEVRAKASHVDASMEGRLVAIVEELRSAKT